MPDNTEFLAALFGENAPWAHVTDFIYDPSNIPAEEHLRAWAGNYASRYRFGEKTNQYFTISNFYCDEDQRARRRKALFWQTPVIVLDDVREKLSIDAVQRLPRPTWILETSAGSEQWGYLLDTPCKDRAKVENLLDGLVANGLAPEGRDPGMKGVTRYVRLPDGYNTKASRRDFAGEPWKCRMLLWEPFNRVTLEQLATPFSVDLAAPRREGRLDGAVGVDDHPLVNLPGIIEIKEVRSPGRFDIVCPWVDEHTAGIDNGTGIFTNADGTIGFKCHHGSCQDRTGGDLLRWLELQQPGFGTTLKTWQANRAFAGVMHTPVPKVISAEPITFIGTPVPAIPIPPAERAGEMAQVALVALRREIPGSIEQRNMAAQYLQAVDVLPEIDRVHWHQQLRDVMRWNSKEFNAVLSSLRAEWYAKEHSEQGFYNDLVYIGEQDLFFDRRKRIFYKPQAFQNSFAHLDSEARKTALEGVVTKVDKLDYAPRKDAVYTHMGITYANSWQAYDEPPGIPGDVSRWLQHWDVLGWAGHRDHMLQWMAWTILHPESKINHMLLLGGAEGIGKDFLLAPLVAAMAGNTVTIPGDALTTQFSQYLLATKYLHINEVSLSDHREAETIGEKLKPLAAAPPNQLYIDLKGKTPLWISNIVNTSMGTNNTLPFKTKGLSRRLYGAWSDLSVRDMNGNVTPAWRTYWADRWNWMNGEGVQACIYYLRNCVDLNNFNPAEAPPVTQFVRDINEASKPALVQGIELSIRSATGRFHADIVTAYDAATGVKTVDSFQPMNSYVDTKYVTPGKMATTLQTLVGVKRRDVAGEHGNRIYYIIRNIERYMMMDDDSFEKEYLRQAYIAQNSQISQSAAPEFNNVVQFIKK